MFSSQSQHGLIRTCEASIVCSMNSSPPDYLLNLHKSMAGGMFAASNPWQQMLSGMAGADAFATVQAQGTQHMEQLNAAIARYGAEPYKRTSEAAHTVWSKGSAQLLHYGAGDAARAIVVFPSLINRHYIHDVSEQRSMVRYLAAAGYDVYLMDWGAPSEAEKGFTLTDYAVHYGTDALQHVRESHDYVALAGHCLGGMLAMASATHTPELVDGLILLATPWEFCSENAMVPTMMRPYEAQLRMYINAQPTFAGEQVLAFFYFKDPMGYQKKLLDFAAAQAAGKDVDTFLSLEQWVNDCVSLTSQVAENCFCDFGLNNMAMQGAWKINGEVITPDALTMPVLLAIPDRDTIVPPSSSKPLIDALPNVEVLNIDAGHVGMIAGSRAEALTWKPMVKWLQEQ